MVNSRSILPDVNVLLAYGWRSHANHDDCRTWFAGLPHFATCAITELGFLRVSMSSAYRATYSDALKVLSSLTGLPSASFLDCGIPAIEMAAVTRFKDITDSYLVKLALAHQCRFATLDEGILRASWAESIAFHPFEKTR